MLAIEDADLRKLLQQRNPEHLPHLIEFTLLKPEPIKLAFVARELGHYHDSAVSDVLIGLLAHEDHRVIIGAIQGLQENGFNQDILHICRFLNSEVPTLAEAARTALSAFSPQRILSALTELPNYPDEKVREAGVFVLSRMSGKPVFQMLVDFLKDKSEKVRQKAIHGMAFQKNPAFIEPLREFSRNAHEEDKRLARKAIIYLQSFVPKPKPGQKSN